LLNLFGIKTYERAMILLMILGLLGGAIVIATGFAHTMRISWSGNGTSADDAATSERPSP
jgi:hypothetical protein